MIPLPRGWVLEIIIQEVIDEQRNLSNERGYYVALLNF